MKVLEQRAHCGIRRTDKVARGEVNRKEALREDRLQERLKDKSEMLES